MNSLAQPPPQPPPTGHPSGEFRPRKDPNLFPISIAAVVLFTLFLVVVVGGILFPVSEFKKKPKPEAEQELDISNLKKPEEEQKVEQEVEEQKEPLLPLPLWKMSPWPPPRWMTPPPSHP